MKKGDVGMDKHFSKKYGNKGWAFDYPVSAIWNQFMFCQDACQCLMLHPYITASRGAYADFLKGGYFCDNTNHTHFKISI